ncbi:MAG: ABC transporter substrate-binding protein [Alphaproteobacteria bacterium]|nr:ABC transporter substrate-binding protein [Alphaproteobacteria bacterium]
MSKTLLKIRGLSLAIGLLLGIHASQNPVQAETKEISVIDFGGAFGSALREAVYKTYTATTGIAVNQQEYNGEVAKIKAMVDTGNAPLEAIDIDAPSLKEGCDAGVLEKLDYSKIGPKEQWMPGTALECGVGTILYSFVIAYDGDKLKQGPTGIKDFFDVKKFPGKRGFWKKPASTLEFALMADGVAAKDVYKVLATKAGQDRAFKKLDTIKKDIVWWEAGAQAPQLLASGEAAMTIAWNGRIAGANKEGRHFVIVWKDQLLDREFWAIPKNSRNTAAAYEFVKYAVSDKVLADVTNYIPYGPARKTALAMVPAATRANLPTHPDNMKASLLINSDFWGDHGDELRNRFNSWLAQ